jgi:hypothetical protein
MDKGLNACESVTNPEQGALTPSKLPGFPTILAVGNEEGFAGLIERLRFYGYLVLVASSFDDAMRVVKIHSRPIHTLVTYGSANAPDWTEIVKPFRLDEIPVVRVPGKPDIWRALAEVRKLVQPPKRLGEASRWYRI